VIFHGHAQKAAAQMNLVGDLPPTQHGTVIAL
jgi:hypothetical protein